MCCGCLFPLLRRYYENKSNMVDYVLYKRSISVIDDYLYNMVKRRLVLYNALYLVVK